ncbi:leucine-rich repeat extensin-like protein 5 [Aplysia californica]|uniref:Leucine-rich repeat extensin-like protein 5 n=1 Tax=Aplysia californica TaxID=6500 RepID=A0ABM1A1R2_APLCA|nr:leucine-rich repeat extensin-like protein 5 [Aplysia californica]
MATSAIPRCLKLQRSATFCEANGIILYCLLAHASYLMQPLDQAFFGSVKCTWSDASRRHFAETVDAVGLDTFAKVFQHVWQKCATTENAQSSYRAAGIFPFCPQRDLESKKMNRVFRDVPSGSSDQPPTLLLPEAGQPEDEPPVVQTEDEPETPAPFEYFGSDDEGPEPLVPFDVPWDYEEEPASNHPTPAMRPPQPCDPAPQPCDPAPQPSDRAPQPSDRAPQPSDRAPQPSDPAPQPCDPALQPCDPAPQSPASQLTTPASQPPNLASTSSHHGEASTSSHQEESTYTAKQLEAMKDFALHVTDELGTNGFLWCIQALSRDATEITRASRNSRAWQPP